MARHKTLKPEQNHVIQGWEVDDSAARLSIFVTDNDLGRVARQLDDGSLWAAVGPSSQGAAEWRRIDPTQEDFVAPAVAAAAQAVAAADSALLYAGMHPDTATALPLVSEGSYFSTPSPVTTESFIYYRKTGGLAVESKRYPSQLLADQVAWAGGLVAADEFPNAISDHAWTASTWASSRQVVNGRACLVFTSGAKIVRVPRSQISGSVVSASVRIESQLASSGTPRVLLQQRTAAMAEVGGTRQTSLLGTGAITSPTTVQFSNVAIDATTVYIDLYLEAGTGALTVSQPHMSGGTIANFRLPHRSFVLNRFTDPQFTGVDMVSGGAGSRIVESYEPALSMTGGIQERNYWIPTAGAMQPGATVYLSCELWSDANDAALLGLYFLDSVGADLGSSTSQDNNTSLSAWVPISLSAVIPANCAYVRVRLVKYGGATQSKWRRVSLSTEFVAGQSRLLDLPRTLPAEVWVSPTGSDGNAGDAANPLASINKAIAVLGGRGRIVMQNGDYGSATATSFDGAYDIEIVSDGTARARIIGGTKLTGITKTGGYTKVYQCAWGSSPTLPWFWEHEVPEAGTLISAAERHPLHRGRVYRLPSTRIRQVASIAAVEAASTPSWYWASNVLYFSITGGGDATVSNIYYPASGTLSTRSSAKKDMPKLSIVGIELWYGELQLTGTEYLLRDFLTVGAYGNGVAANLARGREERCEFAGSSNDGSGAHGQPEPTWPWSPVEASVVIVDPYWHDNGDDGWSIHERCSASIFGGLVEYNTGCGLAPAYGAHLTAYGTHLRRNDPTGAKGGGAAAIGTTTGLEGGVGTQATYINCLAEDEYYGFAAGAADATVTCIRCHTARCVGIAYRSAAVGSVVNLINCTDDNSATVRGGSGTVNVKTGTPVV